MAGCRVHVGAQASEIEDEIRRVHPRHDRRRADRADMHAQMERMVHGKRAFAEHRGQHRRAHLFRQLDQILRHLVAMEFDARDQHRMARRVEHRGRLAGRLFDLAQVRVRKAQASVPLDQIGGNVDLAIDHVAMNLDITGALLSPDRRRHLMEVARRGAWIGQDLRRTSDFAINPMLRLDLARLMMDKGPEFAFLLARSAGKNQQWHALREGAGDGVHHIVPAGAIRHADNADLAGRPARPGRPHR